MKYYFFYLRELKNRLLLLSITGIAFSFTAYYYKEVLLYITYSGIPFTFIHTSITEVFYIYTKLISFFTNQVCMIYSFFHFVVFLSPGLYNYECRTLKMLFSSSVLTFLFGIIIINFVFFPLSFDFFLGFQNSKMFKPLGLYFEAKIEDYLCFYLLFYNTCHLYCQFFVFSLFFFSYFLRTELKEIRFYRKLFYFFFLYMFYSLPFVQDLILQIFFYVCIIVTYEITVFYLLVKNVCKTLILKQH